MKLSKKLTLTVPAFVMVLSLAAVPVMAHDGTSGSHDVAETPTSTPTDSHSGSPTTESNTETHHSSVSPEVEKEVEHQNTVHAKTELAEMEKDGHKKHSDDERKKNCQGLQHGLETKLGNLIKNAEKHQARIDGVLTKAQAYQAEHKVNGADELITTAKEAQVKSLASVAALKSLKVSVDCNDPKVAEAVASFKAGAAAARGDLLSYRQSVKAVLASFEQAKDAKETNQ